MKRIIAFVLICTLLLAGLSMPAAAETEPTVKVSNVDQLLAAIRPGAVIELEDKEYCLQDARGYGTASSDYWYWSDCYDGFELIIHDVDGLTVTGPEGTYLITAPRYANVLNFRQCRNITLNGLIIGHSPEQGACCGGVINLENCSGITVENSVLFGCGVTALLAFDSDAIVVRASTLTECSWSGAELYRCDDVLIDSCTVSEIGAENDFTGSTLYVESSRYVTVMNSGFLGNATENLMRADASAEVALLGCRCEVDKLTGGAFYLEATDLTISNCAFPGMQFGNICCAAYNPGRILDLSGNQLSSDALVLMKQAEAQKRPERMKPAAERTAVQGGSGNHYYEVSTPDEFLDAIGSHRVICLTRDIDLSQASHFGQGYTDCWRWESIYDGSQLVIHDVKDLTVTAKQPGISFVTSPRHADVLTFKNCRDIALEGLKVGHTEIPMYECSGAVLVFDGCSDMEIEDCALFGCGTIGLQAMNCRDIEMEDTEVYDCTQGGVWFYNCSDVELEHCSVHDCAFPMLSVDENCSDIEIEGVRYSAGDYYGF